MKWVMTIPSLADRDGGPPRAVSQIAEQLTLCGDSVVVVTQRPDGEPSGDNSKQLQRAGVRVVSVGTRKRSRFRFSIAYAMACRREARDADVVTTHGFYQFPSVAAWLAVLGTPTAFLLQPHGVFEPYQQARGSKLKGLYLNTVGRALLLRVRFILVASGQEAAGIQESLPRKSANLCRIVGVGVRTDRQLKQAERTNREVLFVSRIAPKKRLDLLIQATALASQDDNERFRLHICGDGDPRYVKAMQTLSAGLDEVTWHGHVSGQYREALENRCSLMCLPSDNENFGQAVTEAMAAGLPVVTTGNTGASEHVQRASAGWVVDAPSPESLKETLVEALSDSSELRAMGGNGADYAGKHLTWGSIANNWRELVAGR